MSNYWIKCPLDVKEKIQQYLNYNLLIELHYYWHIVNRSLYGFCDKCKGSLSYYDKYKIDWDPLDDYEDYQKEYYLERKHNFCNNCRISLIICRGCQQLIPKKCFTQPKANKICDYCINDLSDDDLGKPIDLCDECGTVCAYSGWETRNGGIYCNYCYHHNCSSCSDDDENYEKN